MISLKGHSACFCLREIGSPCSLRAGLATGRRAPLLFKGKTRSGCVSARPHLGGHWKSAVAVAWQA
jgi:hypothetical protein